MNQMFLSCLLYTHNLVSPILVHLFGAPCTSKRLVMPLKLSSARLPFFIYKTYS